MLTVAILINLRSSRAAVPEQLAARIREVAGDDPSAWFATVAQDALLKREAAAVAEFETDHADEAWERERCA